LLGIDQVMEIRGSSGQDWYDEVVKTLGIAMKRLCAYGLCSIWWVRNDLIFNN